MVFSRGETRFVAGLFRRAFAFPFAPGYGGLEPQAGEKIELADWRGFDTELGNAVLTFVRFEMDHNVDDVRAVGEEYLPYLFRNAVAIANRHQGFYFYV